MLWQWKTAYVLYTCFFISNTNWNWSLAKTAIIIIKYKKLKRFLVIEKVLLIFVIQKWINAWSKLTLQCRTFQNGQTNFKILQDFQSMSDHFGTLWKMLFLRVKYIFRTGSFPYENHWVFQKAHIKWLMLFILTCFFTHI